MVPQSIFDNRGNGSGAPVLFWIYGGGYTAGDKTTYGSPSGLLTRGESNNASGVIYVSINYRLGAFGWLSGPTFQENGAANAGLLDQRFALEWVQQYIHLFGGDKDRVTVFGESAGGGSIMHQITVCLSVRHMQASTDQTSPGLWWLTGSCPVPPSDPPKSRLPTHRIGESARSRLPSLSCAAQRHHS